MTLVDSSRRTGAAGAPLPLRYRNRGGGAFASFARIHLRGMDPRRTVFTVLSLALGAGSLLAVLLLLQAVNRPFTELSDLANAQRPGLRAVRSVVGDWLPEESAGRVPRESRPVPVVVGFANVVAGGRGQGAILVGGDCRLRRLGILRDCARVREALAVLGPGYPLVPTRKLARALGVQPGDRVLLPGGSVAHVAGLAPFDPRLERLNDGYLAFGLVPDVADLLGHPGSVTAVVLSDRRMPPAAVADAVGPGAVVGPLAGRTVPPTMVRAQQLYAVVGVIAAFTGVFLAVSTFLVGAVERRRSLAIVDVLGSGRRRLVGGYLAEGALVGVIAAPLACVAGVLAGSALVRVLGAELFFDTGIVAQISVPANLLLLAAGVAVVLGVIASAITVYSVVSTDPIALLGSYTPFGRTGFVRPAYAIAPAAGIVACLLLARFGGHGGMPQLLTLGIIPVLAACLVGVLVFVTPLLVRLPPPIPTDKAYAARMIVRSDLNRSPMRTALTIATIGLGVMIFVSVQGFRASNEEAMATGLPRLSAGTVVVYPRQVGNLLDPPLSDEFLDGLRADSGVAALTADVFRLTATVLHSGLGVAGFDRNSPLLERALDVKGVDAVERQAILDRGEAILTDIAAGDLSAGPGSTITLPTVQGNVRIRGGAVGRLAAGEPSGLGAMVFMDLDVVRRLWDSPLTGALFTPKPRVTPSRLRRAMPRQEGVYYPTASETAHGAQMTLRRFLAPFIAVGWMAMLAAALGVLNMLVLSLLARRKERATMRTIGLSIGQEAGLVIGNALTLAGYGALLGVGVGLLLQGGLNLSAPVTTTMTPPFVIDWPSVVGVAFVACVVSLLGAILPLAQLRGLDVVAALREE